MTATSDAIIRLLSHGWDDWVVSSHEVRQIVSLLRRDPEMPATVRALRASPKLAAFLGLFNRPEGEELVETVAAGSGHVEGPSLVNSRGFPPGWRFTFTVANDLHHRLRQMGASFAAAPFAMITSTDGPPPTAPFTGVGATGVSPAERSIPLFDQARLAAGHDATLARYSNPIPGSLTAYLDGLSRPQRLVQVTVLVRRPITSFVQHSYLRGVPPRSAVLQVAAARHALHPATVTAFLLAEQRDQSANEDAADFTAATSIARANTSIGLGQVVVSTARRYDLFSDVLGHQRRTLSHTEIAALLASDEFNIFAVAKFIRLTADRAARLNPAEMGPTVAAFPGIDFPAFGRHSREWPDDNIRALGSEYTSAPWDNRLSVGWADFVLAAHDDVRRSGVFP